MILLRPSYEDWLKRFTRYPSAFTEGFKLMLTIILFELPRMDGLG
jgi:hypothetical protein